MEKKDKAIIYLAVLAIVLLGIGLVYSINWLTKVGVVVLGTSIIFRYTHDY